MMRYLLDTNHLSPLVTVGHPLRPRILQQMRQGDQFAIAVPALAEFLYGIQVVPRGRQNLIEWNQLRSSITLIKLMQNKPPLCR